ncbi:hypothetical protein [Sphingomonas crusticola]|uniref:hypothetical protein n=1 Tax=Sphingomonas crusticola TaxID=1697973 RepID=UPI000E2896E3|nr:hypothetical protein [Sphingomonas crusticola]
MKTIAVAALAIFVAAPCLAQAVATEAPFFSGTIPADPSLPGTVRLTPEQREAALEYGATHPQHSLDGATAPDGRIHGEMGVEIGTGGYRSTYGTAVVPLGDTGSAAFSFESERARYRRRGYQTDRR